MTVQPMIKKGDLIFKTNDGSDGASPTERSQNLVKSKSRHTETDPQQNGQNVINRCSIRLMLAIA